MAANCLVCDKELSLEEFRACAGRGHHCTEHLPPPPPPPEPKPRVKVKRKRRQKLTNERRRELLEQKLALIAGTPDDAYLRHVNHCGWLFRNIELYFVHTKNQWGASVKTRVLNLTVDEMQQVFVDATGQLALSTLQPTIEADPQHGAHILGTTRDFAVAIIDFLNLEFVVDIDAILAETKKQVGDTGFKALEAWGGTREIVLERLKERRADLDPEEIERAFDLGCEEDSLIEMEIS